MSIEVLAGRHMVGQAPGRRGHDLDPVEIDVRIGGITGVVTAKPGGSVTGDVVIDYVAPDIRPFWSTEAYKAVREWCLNAFPNWRR